MKVRPVALDDTPRENEPVARQKVEKDKENFIWWSASAGRARRRMRT